MMTALLAARNILGLGNFDTWKVNTDAEYHEGEAEDEVPEKGAQRAPSRERGVKVGCLRSPAGDNSDANP